MVSGRMPKVTFLPSPETFKITEFDFERLEHSYRELAFLNSGVRLVLADARHADRSIYLFDGRVVEEQTALAATQ